MKMKSIFRTVVPCALAFAVTTGYSGTANAQCQSIFNSASTFLNALYPELIKVGCKGAEAYIKAKTGASMKDLEKKCKEYGTTAVEFGKAIVAAWNKTNPAGRHVLGPRSLQLGNRIDGTLVPSPTATGRMVVIPDSQGKSSVTLKVNELDGKRYTKFNVCKWDPISNARYPVKERTFNANKSAKKKKNESHSVTVNNVGAYIVTGYLKAPRPSTNKFKYRFTASGR